MAYIPLIDTIIRTDEVRIYMSEKQKVTTKRSPDGVMLIQLIISCSGVMIT